MGATPGRERAVVVGASMAGLLAARVLSDFYGHVTVFERDALPDEPVGRRGVPQGRHVHIILSRGAQVLEDLFPGLLGSLVAEGAPFSGAELGDFWAAVGGRPFPHEGSHPGLVPGYQPSRPLLEHRVRERVGRLANVSLHGGHHVRDFVTDVDRSVTGVRVSRDGAQDVEQVSSDLVVDASGRAARSARFLKSIGYDPPPEQSVDVGVTYCTQHLRIEPGTFRADSFSVVPSRGHPWGAWVYRNENDSWVCTVFGVGGMHPPTDFEGMLELLSGLIPAHVAAAARSAQRIGPVVQHRFPATHWLRFDRLKRFPSGLLPIGDAIASLNPIYGQGMTVAAMHAEVLHEVLASRRGDLTRRYLKAVARPTKLAWSAGAVGDLSLREREGRLPMLARVGNAFGDLLMAAALDGDIEVYVQFLRVAGFDDAASRMFRPAILGRVVGAAIRRRVRGRRSAPSAPGTTPGGLGSRQLVQ
jgi:2-polyprenyl-6-methoxyphenol hydroxylase-like FAD-dependent oxidoreductase